MIRVSLPYHLRNLAGVGEELEIKVDSPVTPNTVIDAIEARFPMLRGTIRDAASGERRAYLRFFACGEDLSHQPMSQPLPDEIASKEDVFRIVGAIAGG